MIQRTQPATSVARDQLAAFLDSHVGVAHSDDVGPLFGQASLMWDSVAYAAAMGVDFDATAPGERGAAGRGTR